MQVPRVEPRLTAFLARFEAAALLSEARSIAHAHLQAQAQVPHSQRLRHASPMPLRCPLLSWPAAVSGMLAMRNRKRSCQKTGYQRESWGRAHLHMDMSRGQGAVRCMPGHIANVLPWFSIHEHSADMNTLAHLALGLERVCD